MNLAFEHTVSQYLLQKSAKHSISPKKWLFTVWEILKNRKEEGEAVRYHLDAKGSLIRFLLMTV